MERLFVTPATRERYATAQLAKERDDFVLHLMQEGCAHSRLRTVAAMLLSIIRIMNLSDLRRMDRAEIFEASQKWADDKIHHRGKGAGPTSAKTFIYVAEKWLSFHGLLMLAPSPKPVCNEIMEEFASSMLHEKGLSPETMRSYRSRILLFFNWLSLERHKDPSKTTIKDVDDFLEFKRVSGHSPGTIASQCQALRTFFRHAASRGWCPPNLARNIYSPSLPKYESAPKGARWRDVKRMLVPVSDKPSDLKSAAILSLCAIYGLRSSEISNLKLSNFDWANETFTIQRAKRGRIQQYPIQYEVGETLIRYLRFGRPHCQCRHVFVTRDPPFRQCDRSALWHFVAKSMKRLEIESEHRGPHALRHACATELLRKGSSLKDIADFLGHRDLKSVSIYAKFDTRSLRQVAAFSLAGIR